MNVAYISNGRTVVGWYRCALPALYSGADWFGVASVDPRVVVTQIAKRSWPQQAHEYDAVVWSMPITKEHRAMIRELREQGVKVIVELDDYLPGVPKMGDHDFRERPEFGKKSMDALNKMISTCDGLIVSTEFLASKYRHLQPNTYVCLNGLDMARYAKSRPAHETVNIGWAGATGHRDSFQRVAQAIADTLTAHENTSIITIGQPFADAYSVVTKEGGPQRHLAIPFVSLEVYTNAMCLFDIALAPARNTSWYRAKSALRYYEAAALGIPVIADPLVYGEVHHGVTGLLVEGEDDWRDMLEELVTNHELRLQMGQNARDLAWTEFNMRNRVGQWQAALAEVIEG